LVAILQTQTHEFKHCKTFHKTMPFSKKHKLSVREREHQKNVLEDKRTHAVAREKNHQKI